MIATKIQITEEAELTILCCGRYTPFESTHRDLLPSVGTFLALHDREMSRAIQYSFQIRNTVSATRCINRKKGNGEMKKFFIFALALSLALIAGAAQAQVTTGTVKGVVTDPNGAVVPGGKVTITRKSTSEARVTTSSDTGNFQFDNLQPGGDYVITVEASNFKKAEVSDVAVQLGQAADVPVQLQTGQLTETVTVSAGGAELVNTTNADLSKGFDSRQVVELAQTAAGPIGGAGVNNLALIAPNVSSSGGVGVGTGGSVGGQRPRNNNFMVDGIDNNAKDVTGPQSYV